MKIKTIAIALVVCSGLTSCFKDEPLNAEADILQAMVADRSELFYNPQDAMKDVLSNVDDIVFTVKAGTDVSAVAPEFVITEGATIAPASGTTLDFSDGKVNEYKVVSQDGQWHRTYRVHFEYPKSMSYYSFDERKMDAKYNKFYVWDGLCSANEGYMLAKGNATADNYPTIYDPDGYKGGCVQLRTVDTGAWGTYGPKQGWRPLAAGNIFFGSFDISKALSKTLEATLFGVPVDAKPLMYSGYYKYKPGPQMINRQKENIPGVDQGAIYAVVYKNHDENGNEVVLTGVDIMTNPNRVGMAKFYDIPATDVWTRFDLKFEYWTELDPVLLANRGYSLVMVGSSSQDGDLFTGAIGSTMWLDEVSFVFEQK